MEVEAKSIKTIETKKENFFTLTSPIEIVQKREDSRAEERDFTAWASVEVIDRQNEVLPIDLVTKAMYDVMRAGGNVTDDHSDRVIGKIIKWDVSEKNGKPGIIVTCNVNYRSNPSALENKIWKELKEGSVWGGMSFSGIASRDANNKILDIIGYSVSLVHRPANPEATITWVNTLAKSENENNNDTFSVNDLKGEDTFKDTKEIVQKPFAGYKDFADCVSRNQDKKNPEAYCATIMREVEGKENKMEKTNLQNKVDEASIKTEDVASTPAKQEQGNNEVISSLVERVAALEKKVAEINEKLAGIEEPSEEEATEQTTENVTSSKSKEVKADVASQTQKSNKVVKAEATIEKVSTVGTTSANQVIQTKENSGSYIYRLTAGEI